MAEYKFKATIQATEVPGDVSDIVLVLTQACTSINAAFWTTVIGINDIRAFASDDSTELDREVKVFDSGNQLLEMWIKVFKRRM